MGQNRYIRLVDLVTMGHLHEIKKTANINVKKL